MEDIDIERERKQEIDIVKYQSFSKVGGTNSQYKNKFTCLYIFRKASGKYTKGL